MSLDFFRLHFVAFWNSVVTLNCYKDINLQNNNKNEKKNDFGNKQKNLLFRNSQPKKVMFMDVDWEWMNVCLLVEKCKNLKIILNDFIVENQ